jgi:hypothetical protein
MATAARSGEIRGASWDEIDLEVGVWIIPAACMKASSNHRVSLPFAAVDLLKLTEIFASTLLIWSGQGLKKPMSDATLAALAKKMHCAECNLGNEGWLDPGSGRITAPQEVRSTLRVWTSKQTEYPTIMAELTLARTLGSAVAVHIEELTCWRSGEP